MPIEATAGRLSGVPAPPPGYVARDELAGLIEAISAVETGAVGLTGQVPSFGLHGQGGIGKSVLAAAVARDRTTRRRFPDGIFWVTVGEAGDVLAAQLGLLSRLAPDGPPPRTPREAEGILRRTLVDRRVLLVVDDVWSDAAAQAFRLTGPQGRVLYTTRDPQVLASVRARAVPVEVLSLTGARALAAAVLAVSDPQPDLDLLPSDADIAIEQVGRVALAVALLAAAVRGGRTWGQVAADLLRDADVFGDHPYANTFKAMQVGVEALPAELSEALISLVVLPRDTRPPIEVVKRYWAHTRGCTPEHVHSDLRRLAEASVLTLNEETASGSIEFHDLQHDYLLLHAPALAELHVQMLGAYRSLLPERGQWWQLPPTEPYIWDHLVMHLRYAGARDELATTVTDPAFIAQRIAARGVLVAENDLAEAAPALPEKPVLAWWRAWLPRYADVLTLADNIAGVSERTRALVPTLDGWLWADPDRLPAVDPQRLRPLSPSRRLVAQWGLVPPSAAQTRILGGHTEGAVALAWSADSHRLATAGADGRVLVRAADTGETTVIGEGEQPVVFVGWAADDAQLLTVRRDGAVQIWDVAARRLVRTIVRAATDDEVLSAAATVNANGNVVLAAAGRKIEVVNTGSERVLVTLPGRPYPFSALAWSPDGKNLVVAHADGWVQVWAPLDEVRVQHAVHSSAYSVSWSPNGDRVAVAGHDGAVGTMHRKDRISRRTQPTEVRHPGVVRAVAWSPDGDWLATAGDDKQVRLWNTYTWGIANTLPGHTRSVHTLAWSPDSTRLATSSIDGQVRIWEPDAADGGRARDTGAVHAVAWSPDGRRLVTAGKDGIEVRDADRGQILANLVDKAISTEPVRAVAWSPDGTHLVAGASDTTCVWHVDDEQVVAVLHGHRDWVRAVAWSPDGRRIVTAGTWGEVRLWDAETGRQTGLLENPGSTVKVLVWSPDGAHVAFVGDDGHIRSWDPADEPLLSFWRRFAPRRVAVARKLGAHGGAVNALAWAPDGTRLASGGADGSVAVWAWPSGRRADVVAGDARVVHSLAWSPDSNLIAVSWSDGEIVVHSLRGVVEPIRFRLSSPCHIDWTDDRIVAAGSDDVIMLTLRA